MKKRFAAVGLFFLVLLFDLALQANVRLTNDPASSSRPAVDFDADGNLVVAWEDNRDGDYEIYWRKFTPQGYPLTGVIKITDNTSNSVRVDISCDGAGNSYLVWQEGEGSWGVGTGYFTILDQSGNRTLPADIVFESLTGLCRIFTRSDGTSDIAHTHFSPGDQDIYFKRLDSTGSSLCAKHFNTGSIPALIKYPCVATVTGIAAVYWQDMSMWWNISLYRGYIYPDCSFGSAVMYDPDTARYPDVDALEPSGILYSVFHYADQIYNYLGGSNVCPLTHSTGSVSRPRVATDGERGMLVWNDNRDGNNEIYLNIFYLCDNNIGDIRLTVDGANSVDPDIAALKDGGGNWAAVWSDNRGGDYEIYLTGTGIKGQGQACTQNNEIVEFDFGTGGITCAAQSTGYPDQNATPLGYEGSLTLFFPCFIVDGEGHDLMVFENGVEDGALDENYQVEVSADGETFYYLGECSGNDMAFDLASIGISAVRYVKIVDLPPQESGSAPPELGADIDAVVALNCQNLIYETPLGEITGTVKDAVSKQLLDGIIVRVVNPPHMRSSALTVSGSYHIPHITPGVCVIEAIDPNGGYIAQTQSNVTVTENGLTPVSFYLPAEEPRIEVTALYFEDDDSKFTMGDHVTLHCELTNRGGPAEDVTLVFNGLSDNDGYPNLRFSPNGSSNWSYTHQESISGLWFPGQTHICQDIHAYIGVVDPDETARRGLDIPRYVKVDISWGGKSTSETINLNSIFFDPVPDFPAGYGDLRGADCLRKAGTSPVVRRYAQYAAANANEENPERDPDTRINAAQNVWDILVAREQFKVDEWAFWRKSDEEMVGQRYGKIGMCRHYMDLSTGLLRALGIHTRDIVVEYKSWVGHGFNEFYAENDQGDFGWIQYDAAQNKFNNRSFYSNNLLFAWGDKNPLSDAGILTLVSCRWECVAQVCPLCIQGSPLGIPYPCFESRLDFYNSAWTSMRTQNYSPSEILDSLVIELTAPKKSYLSTPFQVTAIVQNNSYHSSPPCYAYLMKNTDVFNTIGVYSVMPDSIYIPALNTGESDTINFTLTPITYRKYSAISMFLCDDLGNFLTGQSISQAIFENETFSSLVVESAVVSGSTIPFETMHVASSVLNDSLDVEDEASVVAYLRSSRDTLFTDSFLMTYDGADSLYRGTYAVPLTAPIGRYDLTVIATHPVLLPDTLEESFSVSSLLEMNISAPDSCAPLDTVIVRTTVTDRGDTVETAGVTLHVAYDSHEEIVIPLVSDSSLCHSGSFIPHACVEQWGGEAFESGLWNLRVSISYGGATVTDSVDLEVIAPDLAIDGSQVSFYPSTPTSLERLTVGVTVKNLGNAPSDSCYVDLYRNQGESLEFLTGGITLPPLAAGDSARVTLYTGTVYWQGTQDLVLIVDDRAQIDDSDRENNLVSRSLTVIEPVTSVHEDYENSPPYRYTLNQNYPNPFNPVTTIEFEIQKRERVTLDIYDIRGARVKRLVDRSLAAGRYRVEWKGKNQRGANVSSGIYFCRIKAGDWESNLKMVLIR